MPSHTGSIKSLHFTLISCSHFTGPVFQTWAGTTTESAAQGDTSAEVGLACWLAVLAVCLHGAGGGFVFSLSVWPLTRVQAQACSTKSHPTWNYSLFSSSNIMCTYQSALYAGIQQTPAPTIGGNVKEYTQFWRSCGWRSQISIVIAARAAEREGQACDRSCGGSGYVR